MFVKHCMLYLYGKNANLQFLSVFNYDEKNVKVKVFLRSQRTKADDTYPVYFHLCPFLKFKPESLVQA